MTSNPKRRYQRNNMARFTLYTGNDDNVPKTENYLVFKWFDGDIFFSITQKGATALCHVSCTKPYLRQIKQAINEWYYFCKYTFNWCRQIAGHVERNSIKKVLEKCKYSHVGSFGSVSIMIREVKHG